MWLEIPYLRLCTWVGNQGSFSVSKDWNPPGRGVRCCILNFTISKSKLFDSLDNRKQDFSVSKRIRASQRREPLWNFIAATWPSQKCFLLTYQLAWSWSVPVIPAWWVSCRAEILPFQHDFTFFLCFFILIDFRERKRDSLGFRPLD